MKKLPRLAQIVRRMLLALLLLLLLVACSSPLHTADSVPNDGDQHTGQNSQNLGGSSAPDPISSAPDPIDVNQEKIGCGYTVLEDPELAPDNSHGSVKNYHSDFQDKAWTVTFDAMNSTAYQPWEIDSRDKLKVKSKLLGGTAWLKITQGDLSQSALQKVQLVYDETITLDLSRWETGEIAVWLVVENGESGMIRLEQDFYAQGYLSTLALTPLTKETWKSPEEIAVPHLLSCTLDLTVNERVKAGDKGYLQEDYKLHVPAEVIEPLVYRYFDVAEDYLRSSSVYDAEKKEYVFDKTPVGPLHFFEIDKISRQADIAAIEFHYLNYRTLEVLKKVRLVIDESRTENKYLSCEVTDPAPADREARAGAVPKTFPKGFATNWSFTGKPHGEEFSADRDIFGISFSLTYDAASGQYRYLTPGMGDCDKIISYTLTGTDFTVVLNGRYKLLYPDIPAWVNINKYLNDHGYEGLKDSYRIRSTDVITGKDGNYYLKIPFDWPYRKGEITYLSFDFGKLD